MTRRLGPLLCAAALSAVLSSAIAGWKRAHPGTPRHFPARTALADLVQTLPSAEAIVPPPPPPPPPLVGPASRTFLGDMRRRHQSALVGPVTTPQKSVVHQAAGSIAAMPAVLEDGDLLVASLGGALARVEPTGEVRWRKDLGDRIYASPLITGDRVIVGSDADRVVALRLADGAIVWQVLVEGDADTAPAEAPDGTIVIAAGSSLYAIRPGGSVRFRFRVPRKIFAAPAIADDGTIYVGAQDDHLYALTLSGARLWRRDLGADIDCAALVGEDGMVYVGTDGGHVAAFDRAGNLRFRVQVGGYVRGGLSLGRDGSVIAGVYGPQGGVVALDPVTGAERFAFRIRKDGPRELGVHGGPLVDGQGNLYFGAHDDTIYALDPGGRLRWTAVLGADVDAPLALGPGGVLYAGTDDGRLHALR